MRSLGTNTQTALLARRLVLRDFLWIVAKDGSNNPISGGYWNDRNQVTVTLISGQDGSSVSRTYNGTGKLFQIDDIPLTSDLSIRTVNVTMSQLNAQVDALIRGYNLRLAQVEIHRVLFDPATQAVIDTPAPRFTGFIDSVVINTPQAGQSGSVVATCVSHTQELTRTTSDKRSDNSQLLRSGTDHFFKYGGVISDRTIFWGTGKTTIGSVAAGQTTSAPRQALDIFKRF